MSSNGEGAAFSFNNIKNFDDHIGREIRGYDILDGQVSYFANAFIESGTNVYDLGASSGRRINQLAQSLDNDPDSPRKVNIVGFEPGTSFVANYTPYNDQVKMLPESVTENTRFDNASLVMSVFTLQFIPTNLRPAILQNIHDGLIDNGAFIWAEKVISSVPRIESVITNQHLAMKREGSCADDILDKEDRIRRIMRPLELSQDLEMLEAAGFKRYEVFWRVNNFLGLIALK